jgi:hypothetical protein
MIVKPGTLNPSAVSTLMTSSCVKDPPAAEAVGTGLGVVTGVTDAAVAAIGMGCWY